MENPIIFLDGLVIGYLFFGINFNI